MSPTDAQAVSLAGAAPLVTFVAPALLGLVIWLVVVPLGLRGIFEALGTDRSRAWIPFVNIATVYRLGGCSEFWLIALVIPVADIPAAIVLFVATHRINRRLGRSGWYTALAVVAWWLWALALGLQRHVDRTAAAEPLIWSAQQRPRNPLTIPQVDDATSSASPVEETPVAAAGFIAPPPGLPLPLVEEQRESPEAAGAPGEAARLQPAPEEEAPAPPAPVTPAPVAPTSVTQAPPAPASVTHASAMPDDDATIMTSGHADATLISPRRRARWWLQTTMGARVELTGAAAILGRRPSPHPLYPGAQLIAVTDDALSVSATHAVLEFVAGEWQVTDLDSTNGVWLLDGNGGETELGARNRARVTPQFMLGELGVRVVQGA